MLIHWLKPLYEGDDGLDGGEGGKVRASDIRAQLGTTPDEPALMRFCEKQAELLNNNFKLRERNRTITQERDEARKLTPAEGGRVLGKDEAAAYEAYVALGKPADLKTALETGKAGQERLATLERDATFRAAAEAHGYKAAALAKLPSLAGKGLVVEDAQEDGKTVKRAFVQHEGGKVALPDYITQHDPEFAGALVAEAATNGGGGGITYPPQTGAGGKPAATNAGKTHIKSTKYAVPGKKEA